VDKVHFVLFVCVLLYIYNTHFAVSKEKKWHLIHLKTLYLFKLKQKKKIDKKEKKEKVLGIVVFFVALY
jgi:hypothetical protein